MTAPILGIDLGTTNSAVAMVDTAGGRVRLFEDEQGRILLPSIVNFHPDGSILVGHEALERRTIDPANTLSSFKRLMGCSVHSNEAKRMRDLYAYKVKAGPSNQTVIATRAGEFSVAEISAIVLDRLRRRAEGAIGQEVSEIVVTVPASFSDPQRSATASAGAIAGLNVIRVLNEPTAAALAFGHRHPLDSIVAVYDLGGGTFDITLLQKTGDDFEVLASAGDPFLGGDDIDAAISEYLAEECAATHRFDPRENPEVLYRLREAAERLKIDLATTEVAHRRMPELGFGPGGKAIDFEARLSRGELEALARQILARTVPVCQEALDLAGLKVDDVDDLLLVGGSTKLPLCRRIASEFFESDARDDVNPDLAVAAGAALQADIIWTRRESARSAISKPAPMTITGHLQRIKKSTPANPLPASDSQDIRKTSHTSVSGAWELPDLEAILARGAEAHETAEEQEEQAVADTAPEPEPEPEPHDSALVLPPVVVAASRRTRTSSGSPIYEISADDVFDVDELDALASGEDDLPRAEETAPHSAPPAPPSRTARVRVDATSEAELPRAEETAPYPAPPPPPKTPAVRVIAPVTDAISVVPPPGPPPSRAFSIASDLDPASISDPGPASEAETYDALISLDDGSDEPWAPPPVSMQPLQVTELPTVREVASHALGISTVGGFFEPIIARNAAIPTECRRTFVTSHDEQTRVEIRICRGDSRRVSENVLLGDLVLDALVPRPRGDTRIEVTFRLDESGMLRVKAVDAATGVEQIATLQLIAAPSPEEVEESKRRLGS